MKREEVSAVLKTIIVTYQNFKCDDLKTTLDAWCRILKDADCEVVQHNLDQHIIHSKFPPTIAELLNKEVIKSRAVPNVEETRAYLKSLENKKPASEEVKKEEAAKVRRILGIEREEDLNG